MKDEVLMKLSEEQGKFVDWLLTQPAAIVLENARRYVHREALIRDVERMNLTKETMRRMLQSQHLLQDLEEGARYED